MESSPQYDARQASLLSGHIRDGVPINILYHMELGHAHPGWTGISPPHHPTLHHHLQRIEIEQMPRWHTASPRFPPHWSRHCPPFIKMDRSNQGCEQTILVVGHHRERQARNIRSWHRQWRRRAPYSWYQHLLDERFRRYSSVAFHCSH